MAWRPVVALGAAAIAAAWLAVRPRRVLVDGDSMLPALRPGDRLLVVRLRPRRGDVVALHRPGPGGDLVLKRIAATPGGRLAVPGAAALEAGDGYLVLGDNAAQSTDSRAFGPVSPRRLVGRAVYRYAPAERRGAVATVAPSSRHRTAW